MPVDDILSSESDDDTTLQSNNTGGHQLTRRAKLLGTQHYANKRKAEAIENNDELVYEYSDSDIDMSDIDEQIVESNDTIINDDMNNNNDNTQANKQRVWQRGVDEFDEATEQLEYDATAYTMLHRFKLDWPCLSFDIINDGLGVNRNKVCYKIHCATIYCKLMIKLYIIIICYCLTTIHRNMMIKPLDQPTDH